jgi:cyclophilin family peptidyl-prolyl cis-trans isomerase/HEAT repeat protein
MGSAGDRAAVERVLVDETARVALERGVRVGPASPLLGVRIGWGKGPSISTPAALGALRGLEWMLRTGRQTPPSPETAGQLRQLARVAVTPARRLSLLALNDAAAADEETIDAALKDADVQVRRLAAAASTAPASLLLRALGDRSPMVRYEALRAWGRRFQAEEGCRPALAAVRDPNAHVALLALDLLGNGCKADEPAAEALKAAAGPVAAAVPGRAVPSRATADHEWHRRSHAIAALARIAPDAARSLLPGVVSADFWVARMYAARAAASLHDLDTLRRLADDRDANVREAAIDALARLAGHDADTVYVRALQATDGQLLMTAARALQGTPNRDAAVKALRLALERLTAADSDSTRDPRLALLDRLAELGTRDATPALEPLLRDFDSRVAERAAAVLASWTGQPRIASLQLRAPQPVPTSAELAQLSRSVVRVTMNGGGRFDIRLLTDLAPLSCAAFARLASSGYYNGLTVHRVVANFVIQGGGPGANEYSGARRFTLDEVGRVTQSRGTVGSSTRGRDTGDGQFYVNLVDNPRLDHEYTIFGEVTRGMEVVDAILEGDVIERAELLAARR